MNAPEEPSLHLPSAGLLSKWGFNDGDPFEAMAEWHHDRHTPPGPLSRCSCPNLRMCDDEDTLLRVLVRHHLAPALQQEVLLVEFEATHNPIRAALVDGVDVTDCWYGVQEEPVLTPASVSISYTDVLAAVAAVTRARIDSLRHGLDVTSGCDHLTAIALDHLAQLDAAPKLRQGAVDAVRAGIHYHRGGLITDRLNRDQIPVVLFAGHVLVPDAVREVIGDDLLNRLNRSKR